MEKRGSYLSLDNIVLLIIFVMPFLRYYEIPVVGMAFQVALSTLGLFIMLILYIDKNRATPSELIHSKRWYVVFFLWHLSITLIYELYTEINVKAANSGYNVNTLIMALITAVFIYFLLTGCLNFQNFFKFYSAFIILIVSVYLIQWLLFTANVYVSFKLPFEYTSAWSFLSGSNFGMSPYPTSLFSEKSHMCEYLLPYIAICLYSEKYVKKNRMIKAAFLSIVVASTVSGNGFVVIFLEWVLYLLFLGNLKKVKTRYHIVIFGIIALIALYGLISSVPRYEEMLARLFVSNSNVDYASSKADYRIYRGFDIFSRLPIFAKIFGVGYSHMYLFSQKYHIVSEFDKAWNNVYEYFSGITQVMIYSGLVGTFCYLKHLWTLFKNKAYIIKGTVIVMLALMFSTEMFLNQTHLMYITILLSVVVCESSLKENS